MATGNTYKQCGCRDSDGKRLGQQCPKLRRPGGTWSATHGRWYYQLELPPRADGRRRPPLRKGGYGTVTGAEAGLGQARELLAIAGGDPEMATRIADAITRSMKQTRELPDPDRVRKAVGGGHDPAVRPPATGEWLEQWLTTKEKSLRPGTLRSYAGHIRLYYQPHIGHIAIDKLRVTDVASVFEAIDELNDAITEARASSDPALRATVKGRRLVGAATQQRIRATLRSAVSSYMKQHRGMLPANPASLVELPSGARPKPVVWTGERVRAWQEQFGKRLAAARARGGRVSPVDIWVSSRPSPVMVWTPAQTQVFLAAARRHRLLAMWRLITTRGLRRGEACGLRRTDTDLDAAVTTVCWQITQLGWDTAQGAPKSDAGERQVALDADTVTIFREHRQRQDKEKEEAGDAWAGSGFEFTDPAGGPLHPADVTDMFHMIAYLAGLPPIRLHDLRHGAATLLLAAGHDMKVVQDTLGLSSITIAADTYTSVLPQLARQSAEDVADLIRPAGSPRTAPRPARPAAAPQPTRRRPGKQSRQRSSNRRP